MRPKKTMSLAIRILGVVLLVIAPIIVLASEVTVPSGESFTISVEGNDFVVQAGSAATSIDVTSTSFTVTTGSADGVTIKSSSGKKMENDGNVTTTCVETGISMATVGPSKTVAFSPSGGTECLNISNAGGGSGGGVGTSAATPTTAKESTTGSTTELTKEPTKEPTVVEGWFKDVTKSNETYIIPLVKLMLAQKTYKMPLNKIYGVKSVTKGSFAIQTLLAVAGKDCGSATKYTSLSKCKSTAVKAKIVNSSFPIGTVTRMKYFEALLNAKNIPLRTDVKVTDLKKVCKDTKNATTEDAKVFLTAKKAGIAGVYTGGKCKLKMAFSKTEAAKFAMRAAGTK